MSAIASFYLVPSQDLARLQDLAAQPVGPGADGQWHDPCGTSFTSVVESQSGHRGGALAVANGQAPAVWLKQIAAQHPTDVSPGLWQDVQAAAMNPMGLGPP